MSQLPPRPRRSRNAKSRRTYREPDSDSDLDLEPVATNPRPTRSSRRLQTYRESSSTESTDQDSDSSSPEPDSLIRSRNPALSTRNHATARRRSQRHARTGASRNVDRPSHEQSSLRSFKRQKLSHNSPVPAKLPKDSLQETVHVPVNTRAPPWQTLEYDILLRIMQCASYPLYTSTFRSSDSIGWLAGVSQLCKSFHAAASAALLWEPPLIPTFRAHGLLDLLSKQQLETGLNYRTKVRSLNIEVKHVLVKKSGIPLEDLLRYTPRLSRLRIYHGHDEMIGKAIWAEPATGQFKWSYDGLFDCLDKYNIRLKFFEWNGRFQDTLTAMSTAHQSRCLSSLEELVVVNFNFTDKQENERIVVRDSVVSALLKLSHLKKVEFRNCTILDTTSMPQLPVGLYSLRIMNCLSLNSEAVALYLSIGGLPLRNLALEGNQVMDLSFIPRLAELCPRLENLSVDLSYEDCSSYRDRDPLYDELLPNGSPTWPESLVSIIVGPLRSLAVSDAEDFYQSLIDAGSSLPYLRDLRIKTLLKDASWRDRARLRAKWQPLFHQVFAANKNYKPTISAPVKREQNPKEPKKRKSARIQEMEDASISEDVEDCDSAPLDLAGIPRQGRCEVLEFDLSDQRPAPEQFREVDFLDDEPSGDEEWNGRDTVPARSRYGW